MLFICLSKSTARVVVYVRHETNETTMSDNSFSLDDSVPGTPEEVETGNICFISYFVLTHLVWLLP